MPALKKKTLHKWNYRVCIYEEHGSLFLFVRSSHIAARMGSSFTLAAIQQSILKMFHNFFIHIIIISSSITDIITNNIWATSSFERLRTTTLTTLLCTSPGTCEHRSPGVESLGSRLCVQGGNCFLWMLTYWFRFPWAPREFPLLRRLTSSQHCETTPFLPISCTASSLSLWLSLPFSSN